MLCSCPLCRSGKDKKACERSPEGQDREADAWEWRPPGASVDPDDAVMPYGESYRDVEERMMQFLEGLTIADGGPDGDNSHRATALPSDQPPIVFVFTHHAAIRCALRAVLEASPIVIGPRSNPQNTSITELAYDAGDPGRRGGWRAVRLFDAAHLECPWAAPRPAGAKPCDQL